MARSRRQELGVGCLVLVAGLLLLFISVKIGAIEGLRDRVEVSVQLPHAAGLEQGAAVRIAGVEVGTVRQLALADRQARVTLALDRTAEVRQDAVVQVRARSVLGEKFVELLPQSDDAPLLVDGDVLTRTRPSMEIDELVNIMGAMLQGADQAAIARAVDAMAEAIERDPERLDRMLTDLETTLDNAAAVSAEGPALVGETRATLTEVRRLSAEVRPLLARTETTLDRVDALATDLPATQAELDALLSDARLAVGDGRAVLDRMDGNWDEVEQILANLSEIDKWELRRLLREEGIKVRLLASEVEPTQAEAP